MTEHGWSWRYDSPIYRVTVAVVERARVHGLPLAEVYQDGTSGGLLCVRVPLDPADPSEHGRSLFLATEVAENPDWAGQVVEADGDCSDSLPLPDDTDLSDPDAVALALVALTASVR